MNGTIINIRKTTTKKSTRPWWQLKYTVIFTYRNFGEDFYPFFPILTFAIFFKGDPVTPATNENDSPTQTKRPPDRPDWRRAKEIIRALGTPSLEQLRAMQAIQWIHSYPWRSCGGVFFGGNLGTFDPKWVGKNSYQIYQTFTNAYSKKQSKEGQ